MGGKSANAQEAFNVIEYDEAIDELDDDDEQTDAEKKTDAFREALSEDSEAYVNVGRQRYGGKGPLEIIGNFPADKYDFQQLQTMLIADWGPGDYRCKLYSKGRVRANKLISIASPLRKNNNDNSPGEMASVLETVLTRMDNMQQTMVNTMQHNNAPAKTTIEMLQEMKLMNEIMNPNGAQQVAPVNPMKDMLENMTAIKELTNLFGDNGGNSGGTDFGELAGMASKLLGKAIDEPAQTVQHAPIPAPVPLQPVVKENPLPFKRPVRPVGHRALAPEPTPEQIAAMQVAVNENNKLDDNDMMLQMGLHAILRKIKQGVDAGDICAFIFESIPEAKIKDYLMRDDSLDHIFKLKEELREHKPFLLDVIEHIKACFHMPSKFEQDYPDHPNFKEDEEPESETIEQPRQDGDYQEDMRPKPSAQIREEVGDSFTIGENENLTTEEIALKIDGESVNESANNDEEQL
jgi:hypothetical protein